MKKILIVEDERPLAEALAYSLEKEGYGVETTLMDRRASPRSRPQGLTSSCST